MVWAVIVALALFSTPALAVETNGYDSLATETDSNTGAMAVSEDKVSVQEVAEKVSEVKQTVQTTSAAIVASVEENTKAIGELKKDEPIEDNSAEILTTLEDINGKLDTIIIDGQESVPEPVRAVKANGATFTAYANVNRTGQYAQYAMGLVPKVQWNHDYVFLQDSSSSYVFISGNLDFRQSGEFTFTNARYTRWYYGGTGTGYVQQSGSGDVVVHANGYVVLSSAGDYPLLDDGVSLLRTEVAFYAICASVVYCIACVRSFIFRA